MQRCGQKEERYAHGCHIWSSVSLKCTLQINIRDLDTPFGTFVNDTKIKGSVQLKTGDVIVRIQHSSQSLVNMHSFQ